MTTECLELRIRVPKALTVDEVRPLLDAVKALALEVTISPCTRPLAGGLWPEVRAPRPMHPTIARIRAMRADLRERGR